MPRHFVPNRQRGALEPQEQKIAQDSARVLNSTGDASEALSDPVIEVVDRPLDGCDQEKLAMMKFMEDDLEIHVHSTTNKHDAQIFELFINGQREVFRRNETKKVKRKYVDLLCRLKTTSFTQREVTNAEGIKAIEYQPHTGLLYPFSIRHDPHPRGPDWFRAVLSEAG